MSRLLVLPIFLIIAPLVVLTGLFTLTTRAGGNFGLVLGARDSRYDVFGETPPTLGDEGFSVKTGDARPLLVEKFLYENHSPMQGLGAYFVEMADKYGVDWRLVPAIGFQESNLGKVIPKGSFNAFGWAIYTGKNSGVYFKSWQDAIEEVTRGMAKYYYAKGLKSPEQIQTHYTPGSNGSWAQGVEFAEEDLED